MKKGVNQLSLFFIINYFVGIALMVFSYRITSGNSWLKSLVSIGVIIIIILFITLLSGMINDGFEFYVFILLTLLLFVLELVFLLQKIYKKMQTKDISVLS